MIRWIFIFYFSLTVSLASSQRIINFNLFPLKNSITIKFTITPGAACTGYTIFHSLDSLNYIPIYDYPQICGNTGANEEVTFTHQSPALFQYNYYKVQLFPVETTLPKKIFMTDQAQSGIWPFPNPVTSGLPEIGLKIFNANNTKFAGFLYNAFGGKLSELIFTTVGDVTRINIGGLKDGVYIVWVTDGLAPYYCKFVVKN